LGNSRDVTRLCNSLMLNYPRVKDYVVFKEFLFIEILRINYPSVYFDLYNRRKHFFEEKSNTGKFEFKKEQRLAKNSNGVFELADKVEPLLEYFELNYQNEKDKIYGFLKDLFYEFDVDKSITNQDSIVRVKRFYIYFNYINFDKVLAYQEFNNAYSRSEEYFCEKIRNWVDNDLGLEVSERLDNISDFNTKSDLEKYARALILFYDLYGNNKTLEYFTYKINQIMLIDKYYDNSPERMMNNIFKPLSEKDLKRKLNFIISFSNEDILSFQNTFLILFNTLIKNSTKFNYELSICVSIANRLPELKDDIINRIKKFILENDHLRGFLLSTLCPNCPKDHIFKQDIELLFLDLKKFEELLQSKLEESKYVKEYLDLYQKCKEENFNSIKTFDFSFDNFPSIEEWKNEGL